MESWRDKVALVTGASAGIGRGIAERLATDGLRVIATHHKPSLKEPIPPALEGKISTFACDVTKEEDVKRLFEFIKENYGELHILVNNASLAVYTRVTECKSEDWRRMFDQNVLAVGMVTREALALMADDGFIINISSTSAHGLTEVVGKHVYCASKHALRLITEGIRAELDEVKPKIRVTMISPGAVAAEIGSVGGWMEAYPNKEYKDVPFLSADDIAETVVRVLTMPPNVLIGDINIRPLGEKILY